MNFLDFKKQLESTELALLSSAGRTEKIYERVAGWQIEYPEFAKLTDGQMHTFWPWDEHKIANDIVDLRSNATDAERESIIHTLLLFTHYELRAGDDYWVGRILKRFKRPEFQRMGTMFAAVELNSHAPFYNEANNALYLSDKEFYERWKLDEDLVERMAFIEHLTNSKDDLISIAGFTFIEGAVLYSSFAFFKHFQAQECGKNLIKNFCRGINMSVGDENTHAIGGALLFRQLLKERNLTKEQKKALQDIIYTIAKVAFDHECKIIKKIFSFGDIKGITAQNLIDFVKHRIDLCLNNLGLKGLFEEDETDGFIESWFYKNINALQFHDFFTGGGSEYDSNWTREAFGEVFDPESEFYEEPCLVTAKDLIESPSKYNHNELANKYLVFGRPDCRFCNEVKDILQSEDIPYDYKEVGGDISRSEFHKFMMNTAGVKPNTVPQVFHYRKDGSVYYVGGGEAFVEDLFETQDLMEAV